MGSNHSEINTPTAVGDRLPNSRACGILGAASEGTREQSQNLLILSCSQRKRTAPGLLPAIDRYDGPAFRVLRRFLQKQPSELLDIYILSAEFGLIPDNHLIPAYDHRMTQQRARELHSGVISELGKIFNTKSYQELFIFAGRDYLPTLDGYDVLMPSGLSVRVASSGLGKKLSELHDWLYGKSPDLHYISLTANRNGKKPCIRGIEVILTPEQVLDVARQGIAEGKRELTNFQSWYVPVDTQQVAPKWLVSQFTGLSVSDFTTQEARRLLAQLGIEVRRV